MHPIPDSESGEPFDRFLVDADESVFELLADRRRRDVLRLLGERGDGARNRRAPGRASIADLARRIALRERAAETDTSAGHVAVPPAAVRRVRISLRHSHVPALADAGVIDFDSETATVVLRDDGRALLARLDAIRGSIE